MTSDCLEHAGHLVSMSGLKLADQLLSQHFSQGDAPGWKYFHALATTSITLRDLSQKLFGTWCAIHGDESGVQHARTLWPKCIAGRWCSVSDVESRLRSCGGQAALLPVVRKIFGRAACEKPKTSGEVDANALDGIALEETAHYKMQMGKWRRAMQLCLEDSVFWVVAEAMRSARQPVIHVSVTWLPQHCFFTHFL